MARDVSRVLAVFPFEMPIYQEAGVPVEFVGHPVLDALPPFERRRARAGLAGEGETLVGLLPGSRQAEVRRLLPVLLGAARRIAARVPGARFAVPLASATVSQAVDAAIQAAGLRVRVVPGESHRVMAAADLVLVASGTATLEAACYGVPMVVVYRLSSLSYALARLVVRGVSHISLPNIVLGYGAVPELIQDRAAPAAVAEAGLHLLEDQTARLAQRTALAEVRTRLGQPGAAERAARAVLRERGDGRRE
jgi:lipid-A-disaccharide synthase